MFKKNLENYVEIIVIEYFFRVIKERGLYGKFRKLIQDNAIRIPRDLRGDNYERDREENPLKGINRIERLANQLHQLTTQMKKQMRNPNDKYEYVTMDINHLLHFFLEPLGVRMEELCMIGEQIFNLTCGTLYGNEFASQQQKETIDDINDPMQLKAKIFQDYAEAMNEGTVDCTFEEYWEMRKGEINDWIARHHNMHNEMNDNALIFDNMDINFDERENDEENYDDEEYEDDNYDDNEEIY